MIGIKKQLKIARRGVSRLIAEHASRGGRFAGGLAAEGFDGGYREALDDVQLALNGVMPNRWRELAEAESKP